MTTPTPIEIIDLAQYDTIPLSEILEYLYMMGIITNVNDPNNIAYTMEAFNLQPTVTVPVMRGGQGVPGPTAISLMFENHLIVDLDQLPTDLGDTKADLGRFWLYPVIDSTDTAVATIIYLWTGVKDGPLTGIPGLGQGFVQIPVGIPGPPGAYADLAESQVFLTPTGNRGGPNDQDSWIAVNDNSIQYITVNGTLTAGSFELIVHVGSQPQTTAPIQHNAISATSLQSAIAALSNVGAGNVVVTGTGPYVVSFAGSLDSQGLDLIDVTSSTLVGGTISITAGTAENPASAYYIAAPQGIQGPCSPLGGLYNVDFITKIPTPGDIFTCSDRLTPGAPTGLSIAGHSASGGNLGAATYFYKVTATMPNGETLASNEVSVTTTGGSSSVQLSWNAPDGNGATGYNVYRGTSAGAENKLVGVIISGTQITFTDVGGLTVTASPPTTSSLIAGKEIWIPVTPLPQAPLLYTIPATAFAPSEIGLEFGLPQPVVGTFNMPQQPFAWVPYVMGQIQVSADNLSLTPLLVGADVVLGNQTHGQLVASGLSDAQGFVTMIPSMNPLAFSPNHFGGAVVPAMHTGTVGTLYVNLVNEGWFDVFDYTNAGAQMSVLVVPILNTVAITAQLVSAKAKIPPPTVAVH